MDLKISQFEFKFIPAQEKAQNGLNPLLLLVHGRTGNLRLLEWYSKRFKIPTLSYMCIQAPYQDKRPDQDEISWSWYLDKYSGLEKSRADLIAMTNELISQGLASSQIYWLGFSQGAAMGLDLALRGPHRLGGVLAISGFCFKTDEYPAAFGPAAFKQRLLITHGTRDEVISFEKAQGTYDKLKALGVPYELKIYDKPHSFHLQKEVPFLEETLSGWVARTEQ